MAAGHDQSRDGSGGNGGAHGVTLEVDVDLAVPPAPGLGGGKHAASAAHVAEGSLARAVGAAAGDARDTGHGAAGTPGLGGGLHAGGELDGVGLTGVLVQAGVHLDGGWTRGWTRGRKASDVSGERSTHKGTGSDRGCHHYASISRSLS